MKSDRSAVRVLVVDDESAVRAYVARVLREAGYDVVMAGDAAEAMTAASTQFFDLLLTDLMMPVTYGNTLAADLRRRLPALRVLYLTGCSDQLFDDQPVLSDAEAFLDKPCTRAGLLEAVSLALSGHIDVPGGKDLPDPGFPHP